jgi:tetratricopeptide (TPR) repeat protein
MAFTNEQGEFEFVGLARAMYIVEVAVEGYQPVRERVDLYLGARRDITIILEPKIGVTSNSSGTALSLRELRIPDKALKSFEKGIRELYENSRPDRSVDYLRKAIDIYPDYDEAYVQLGLAYLRQGQYAEAQGVIETATVVNPTNARAYMALGTLYNQQGRAQDAFRSLQRALELDPHAWQVHYELGKSLLQLGRAEDAYRHARRALQLNGQGPALHLLVYNLCIRRGDYQAALVEMDEFVKLYPAHPAVPKLLEKREGLRQTVAATIK